MKLVGVDWDAKVTEAGEDEWEGEGGIGEAFEKALQRATEQGVDVSDPYRIVPDCRHALLY